MYSLYIIRVGNRKIIDTEPNLKRRTRFARSTCSTTAAAQDITITPRARSNRGVKTKTGYQRGPSSGLGRTRAPGARALLAIMRDEPRWRASLPPRRYRFLISLYVITGNLLRFVLLHLARVSRRVRDVSEALPQSRLSVNYAPPRSNYRFARNQWESNHRAALREFLEYDFERIDEEEISQIMFDHVLCR